ncbi:hypothetical protein CF319_g8870 [Tilletia indica]|nr:hypothetical protein CF319_g8870 [Tilletia indica]
MPRRNHQSLPALLHLAPVRPLSPALPCLHILDIDHRRLSQDADRDASAVLAAALRLSRYTPAFGGSAGTIDTSQAAIAAVNSSHKSNAHTEAFAQQLNKAFAIYAADRASTIEHRQFWATYEVVTQICRHVLGEEDDVGDDEDRENTRPDTERSGVRQRTSRLNPDRSTSNRRAAIARRQAASGATLTRQEMGDDDFVMGSDSEYDEYRSSRARKRSTSSSPRKRSGSTSPSKRSAASSSQRSREEVIQAVRSAKTARLAATARLHASAYFPTTSTSASSSTGIPAIDSFLQEAHCGRH